MTIAEFVSPWESRRRIRDVFVNHGVDAASVRTLLVYVGQGESDTAILTFIDGIRRASGPQGLPGHCGAGPTVTICPPPSATPKPGCGCGGGGSSQGGDQPSNKPEPQKGGGGTLGDNLGDLAKCVNGIKMMICTKEGRLALAGIKSLLALADQEKPATQALIALIAKIEAMCDATTPASTTYIQSICESYMKVRNDLKAGAAIAGIILAQIASMMASLGLLTLLDACCAGVLQGEQPKKELPGPKGGGDKPIPVIFKKEDPADDDDDDEPKQCDEWKSQIDSCFESFPDDVDARINCINQLNELYPGCDKQARGPGFGDDDVTDQPPSAMYVVDGESSARPIAIVLDEGNKTGSPAGGVKAKPADDYYIRKVGNDTTFYTLLSTSVLEDPEDQPSPAPKQNDDDDDDDDGDDDEPFGPPLPPDDDDDDDDGPQPIASDDDDGDDDDDGPIGPPLPPDDDDA